VKVSPLYSGHAQAEVSGCFCNREPSQFVNDYGAQTFPKFRNRMKHGGASFVPGENFLRGRSVVCEIEAAGQSGVASVFEKWRVCAPPAEQH
jgi:hypothetical protein